MISGFTSMAPDESMRDAARKDVGVAEDVLDPRLAHHGLADVVGDRLALAADEDHAAAGAERVEDAGGAPRIARAFEDDVGAPAVGAVDHGLREVLRADVDRA